MHTILSGLVTLLFFLPSGFGPSASAQAGTGCGACCPQAVCEPCPPGCCDDCDDCCDDCGDCCEAPAPAPAADECCRVGGCCPR
jgi:hypothetical protein